MKRCDRTGRFSGACAPVATISAMKNPYGMVHFGVPTLG